MMVRSLARWPVILRFAFSISLVVVSANADTTAPVVDLGYAQYQGFFDAQANVTQFLGIRYAAPPVGELRFQAPRSPVQESDVQLATQNPNMCYQTWFGYNTSGSIPSYKHRARQNVTQGASEDCLFLNVFVPGTMSAQPVASGGLPVLVWIHGGGYVSGSAAMYNGVNLVVDSLNGVIVVVIQYRLGAFGFLPGNEVKSRGALNVGLLDQNLALQWVQDKIGLFGGDKAHVTIWGESAGGGSVFHHMIANGGNTQPPLFNAVIAGSLYLPTQYYYNEPVPQSLYDEFVASTECASSTDTFTCLQSAEAETLQNANYDLATSAFYGTFVFNPVVDGTFIVERPTVTLDRGRLNGEALLSFTNQNEGNIFINMNETLPITDYVSQLFPDMAPHRVQEVAHIYREYENAIEQDAMVIGDSLFLCPTYRLLKAFSGRSWKGLFAVPPAYHADDLAYYFSAFPPLNPLYNNTQFINAFSQSFMSFARYYDVNTKFDPENITPGWNDYRIGETEMLFNHTEQGVPAVTPIRTDPTLHQRCAFWDSVARSSMPVGWIVLNDDRLDVYGQQ